MWGYILDKVARTLRILNKNQPANEGAGLLAESTFAVGCPEVVGTPYGLLCPIVEVVTEGWINLALELKGGIYRGA